MLRYINFHICIYKHVITVTGYYTSTQACILGPDFALVNTTVRFEVNVDSLVSA